MVLLQQQWEAVSCLHIPLRSASAPPWGRGQAALLFAARAGDVARLWLCLGALGTARRLK